MTTATDPYGTVHQVEGPPWRTICGHNAESWSQAVTAAQEKGLVLFCPMCQALLAEAQQHGGLI